MLYPTVGTYGRIRLTLALLVMLASADLAVAQESARSDPEAVPTEAPAGAAEDALFEDVDDDLFGDVEDDLFEGADDGTVRLAASWRVNRGSETGPLRETRLQGSWAPGDYGSLVTQMRDLVAQWAAEIGEAL